MESLPMLDCGGRRRSPATRATFHQGFPPRNKGLRYPPDPPTVEEIIAVMHAAGEDPDGVRLRGVIVVLWRAGLRISEALALTETDLDADRGALLVRRGKGGKRREVGMDRWAWTQLEPWLELRTRLPVGALFCVLRGPTRGRPHMRPAPAAATPRRNQQPHRYHHPSRTSAAHPSQRQAPPRRASSRAHPDRRDF
jgi:site-specific recombinase XerC